MHFTLIVSFVVSVLAVLQTLEILWGFRKIPSLDDISPVLPDPAPKVSIIVSALNEADTIEPALMSLLALAYPNLEIIAINDRSTDATPAILDRIVKANEKNRSQTNPQSSPQTNPQSESQTNPVLRVLHIDTLPAGWLGKNHALHQGAFLAGGDYFLFTDADVMFKPDAIGRAVTYCQQQQLDHLTLIFKMVANGTLLRMLILSFQVGFLSFFKPWKVNHSPKHFCGLGGFNLMRREAYLGAGGHAALPMAVVDDMWLGKLMKAKGYRQHVLDGTKFVAVEWYPGVPEMFKGLQKNFFAGLDYRFSVLILISCLILLLRVWPMVGLFVTTGAAWWFNLLTIVSGLILYVDLLRKSDYGFRCLIFAPVVVWIELAIYWYATLMVLKRGGIDWRGTFYRLEELKRHAKTVPWP